MLTRLPHSTSVTVSSYDLVCLLVWGIDMSDKLEIVGSGHRSGHHEFINSVLSVDTNMEMEGLYNVDLLLWA